MPEARSQIRRRQAEQRQPAVDLAGNPPMNFLTNLEMNMNRKIAIAFAIAAAASAAGNAFADDITVDNNAFVSSRSRAEVQAELAQYKRSGVNTWSIAYNPLRSLQGTRSRGEVAGEYIASRNQVAALTGEDSGSAYLARSREIRASTNLAGQPHEAQ